MRRSRWRATSSCRGAHVSGRAPSVLGDPKAVIALAAARSHAQRAARRVHRVNAQAPVSASAPAPRPVPVVPPLLLLDATKSGAGVGVRVGDGLAVVAWLLVACGFATASNCFLGIMRDRLAGLRAAAFVVSAGLCLAFLFEATTAVVLAAGRRI